MRYFFTIFTSICILCTGGAHAQLLEPATPAKEVAMLFHKIAGIEPDYDAWAKTSQDYVTAVDDSKEEVLKDQAIGLKFEYGAVDPEATDVVVRTQIAVKVDDSKKKKGLILDFKADGPLFFPYQHIDKNYALIAQNIDLLKFIPLGSLEATYIKNKVSAHGKTYMVLKIRPHRVDASAPTKIFDQYFWPLLGRIASIHLYNRELETLWSWTSDWYIEEQGGA